MASYSMADPREKPPLQLKKSVGQMYSNRIQMSTTNLFLSDSDWGEWWLTFAWGGGFHDSTLLDRKERREREKKRRKRKKKKGKEGKRKEKRERKKEKREKERKREKKRRKRKKRKGKNKNSRGVWGGAAPPREG